MAGHPGEEPTFFRPRGAAQKTTTFVKNDLSAFALVHAYISDALFKIRTSSIACTSKNPVSDRPSQNATGSIRNLVILYPAPTADIRDVRQGSK
jgi:hypothetical protein